MKTLRKYALFIMSAMFVVACGDDPEALDSIESGGGSSSTTMTFDATIKNSTIGDIEVANWDEIDEITLVAGSTVEVFEKISESNGTATFKGAKGDYTEAFAPASSKTMTMSGAQTLTSNGVDTEAMMMRAEVDGDEELVFENLCGVVTILIKSVESYDSVSKISIVSEEGISGNFTYSGGMVFSSTASKQISGSKGQGGLAITNSEATKFNLVAPPTTIVGVTITNSEGSMYTEFVSPLSVTANAQATSEEITFDPKDIELNTGTYEIYSAGGLRAFRDMVNGRSNYTGITVEGASWDNTPMSTINGKLMCDVDLSDEEWIPMGMSDPTGWNDTRYSGTFDGNNCIIRNLTVSRSTTTSYRGGLFSTIHNGAVVKNVKLVNVDIASGKESGCIVGNVEGANGGSRTYIQDCTIVSGSLTSTSEKVGGVAGNVGANVEISGCSNYASIYTTSQILGGIVCEIWGTGSLVTNCENHGALEVAGGGGQIGGIVGRVTNKVEIVDSKNTASVKSTGWDTGGIVGYVENAGAKITGCENSGNVNGANRAGGIAGCLNKGNSTIQNCTNSGNVNASTQIAGGIIGLAQHNCSVIGSSNSGSVSGANQVGGVAAQVKWNSALVACYNKGSVTGSNDNTAGVVSEVGGAAAEASYTNNNWADTYIIGCYNTGVVAASETLYGVYATINSNASIQSCYSTKGSDNSQDGVSIVGSISTTEINAMNTAITTYNSGISYENFTSAYQFDNSGEVVDL